MLPLKALKRSRKASKNEAGSYLNSVLSILPSKRNTKMTSPNVKKNLVSSSFLIKHHNKLSEVLGSLKHDYRTECHLDNDSRNNEFKIKFVISCV